MAKDSPLVILDDDVSRSSVFLKIVSPSRNNTTQFYSDRVQVSRPAFENLNQKLIDKLFLHRINEV